MIELPWFRNPALKANERLIMKQTFVSTILTLAALLAGADLARAQSTGFTYQGDLLVNGSAATGAYDFQFGLFTNSTAGSAVSTITSTGVGVTNGLFTTVLDFGNAFNGSTFWLNIGIRPSGGGSFTSLSARQQLTATPYALYAPSAGTVTGVLAVSNFPASPVFTGTVTAAGFSGNGAGLTNVSASSPTSGNYLFAYDNTIQTFTSGANNYQTVVFNVTPTQISGWSPAGIFPYQYFTAGTSGLYLFQYQAEILGTGGRTVTFRGYLNNTTEIPGSEVGATLGTNILTAISKSFMTNVNANDTFRLQFTADGATTITLTNSTTIPIRPTVSLTIIRIN
jgi:hypothetical protein